MRLIIHDLKKEQADQFLPQDENTKVIYQKSEIKPCRGCFGCWVRTPGKCGQTDGYEMMGELFAQTEELVIVSRCVYGSFSPFVKMVLDRSLSYLLPDFQIIDGEMHHLRRYENQFRLRVLFYGEDITEWEKETAKNLVYANAKNLNAQVEEIEFDPQDLGGLPC